MNSSTFDTLTRRASLAGAGLGLATMALPFAANARNKNKKRKKKARKKCQSQVDVCSTLLRESNCGDTPDPECLAFIDTCCQFLATCDFTGLIACINTPA